MRGFSTDNYSALPSVLGVSACSYESAHRCLLVAAEQGGAKRKRKKNLVGLFAVDYLGVGAESGVLAYILYSISTNKIIDSSTISGENEFGAV